MDFSINDSELSALHGLPHVQQLAYLRGIRPYMDGKTGIVGIKRKISYQSIAEQLYIEPHPGIKSVSYSRAQMIRAVAGLERAGIVSMQSGDLQLILKCEKATLHYSVQNKAITNPSHKVDIFPTAATSINTSVVEITEEKANTVTSLKAVTPLINNNYLYIYLSQKFEKFFESYPEKKSQQKAWVAFQQLNPSDELFSQIMQALENQKAERIALIRQGSWVASWKYPANWLAQKSWEDHITQVSPKEYQHADEKNIRKNQSRDPFEPYWDEYSDDDTKPNNIVQFGHNRQR